MRHRKLFRVGAVLAASTLALTACGGDDGGAPGDEVTTLKIGFMGDLTGANSALVIPPRNGAKLAIAEYNAKNPDVKLQLVEYDSQGDPGQAVPLAQKAVTEDKVVAMIGPAFSGESKNVGPILEQAKIPSVTPSATNPDLAKNGWKYWHRAVANDAFQGPGIANFLLRAKAPKKVYIIDDRQEYSAGIADEVEKVVKAKGVTTGRDRIDPQGSDYSSTVNKAKAFGPDLIFYGGYYAQAGRLLKQLRDGGVTVTFASGDGSADQALVEASGAAAGEGAVLGCPCKIAVGSDEPALKKFETDYQKAYGIAPAIYGTEGYDVATAFIKAVEDGNTTSEEINEFLKTVDFDGLSKQIKFDPATGENTANLIFIHVVKGGKLSILGDAETATLG